MLKQEYKLPVIAHFDLDCFFVAVERIKNPRLRGKPVIIGGDPLGRSVVSSASYEARECGVRSAMPVGQAIRLCPGAVFIKGNFKDYDFYHDEVRRVVESFSPVVEMTSIDEGYVDLSGTERLWGEPVEAADRMRWQIKVETGLDCSIGVAVNRLVAKVATNFVKPKGVLWIKLGEEKDFLSVLPVEELPGVGEQTKLMMRNLGVSTIGDLACLDPGILESVFGLPGRYLHKAANGICEKSIVTVRVPKSIGRETTFLRDTTDFYFISAALHYLVEKVCKTLRERNMRALTVTVRYRYEDFETHSCSRSLQYPMVWDENVYDVALNLLKRSLTRRVGVKLIGVSLSNLVREAAQLEIFPADGEISLRSRALAIDSVRNRFGFNAILAGDEVRLLNYAR